MGESDRIIGRLLKEGWVQVSQAGSHKTFKHPTIKDLITVTHPRKDVSKGLRRAIERTAGWR